jgi:putrescine transport system permease protein
MVGGGGRGAHSMKTLHSIRQRFGLSGKTAVIAGPYLWLVLLFLVPFLLVVKISFSDSRLGIPPYTELAS